MNNYGPCFPLTYTQYIYTQQLIWSLMCTYPKLIKVYFSKLTSTLYMNL